MSAGFHWTSQDKPAATSESHLLVEGGITSVFRCCTFLLTCLFGVTEQQDHAVPKHPADVVQPDWVPLADSVGDAAKGWPCRAQEKSHGKDWLRQPVSLNTANWDCKQSKEHKSFRDCTDQCSSGDSASTKCLGNPFHTCTKVCLYFISNCFL